MWGDFSLILVLCAAVFLSFRCKIFYIAHPIKLLKYTLFSKKVDNQVNSHSLTNFQTLTTALAASMGTGNIIGVAAAISIGGAGAVFWMIVSAFLVMSFAFTENILATVYKNRSKESDSAGPLLYIDSAFGSNRISIIFSVVCIAASFVIGNITQVNSAAASLDNFNFPTYLCGVIFALLTAFAVFHSRTTIAKITEKLVPFAACFYIAGSVIILLIYNNNISNVLTDIFTSAFGLKQISGGVLGCTLSKTISIGVRRGLFSNEAGMGTSTFAHTSSDCKNPTVMGCWAALEVFIDTVLLCTLTALVILCTGADKLSVFGADTVIAAFRIGFEKLPFSLPFFSCFTCISSSELSCFFSEFGAFFLAASNSVFAFASVIGWFFYGERCCSFLEKRLNVKSLTLYKFFYVAAVFFGASINVDIVWQLADIFTFLMLIPNLSAILLLSNQITPYISVHSIINHNSS
ncbi:MAG: alanine/glycine:cation symporter family protein [Oscillospiraceae bacterium]